MKLSWLKFTPIQESTLKKSENEEQNTLLNRKEDKYFLPRKNLEKITTALREKLKGGDGDVFTRTCVNQSIYFDSQDMDLLRDGMDDILPRFKLRIRRYAPSADEWEDVAYLELKMKTKDGLSKKVRVRIPASIIPDIEKGNTIADNTELEKLNKDISKEVFWKRIGAINGIISKYGTKKQIEITYFRRAFSSDKLRVTIDDDIRYMEAKPISDRTENLITNSSGWKKIDKKRNKVYEKDYLILEVKHTEGVPNWLEDALDECKAKKTSFSKYNSAIASYLENGKETSGPVNRSYKVDSDNILADIEGYESLDKSEDLVKAPVEYITDPQETHKKIAPLNETYPLINKVTLPNGLVYQQHTKNDYMGPVHVHHLYHPNEKNPIAEIITRPDPDNEMNHKVSYSQVSPDHKGKGLGKQAYLAALIHGKGVGRLLSDNELSRNAHKMWTSLKGVSGLGGKIGSYVTHKMYDKGVSPAKYAQAHQDQHQVFVKNKKALDHNALFPSVDIGDGVKETKLAASEENDLNKSRTFKTSVSSVSPSIGLEKLKQIKQDHYVGAGGKDYDPDELHQRMFEIQEKQAAKQKLFPEQESEKTRGSFEQMAPPMPGKKMFGKSDLIPPMIEKGGLSNDPENTKLLYHGAPSKVYDKIKNEGFKLTSGQRSGPFGSTEKVQNQGIFLSDTPAVAHFFGQNRTGHEGGYTYGVHKVNAALGNNLDLTQKWPSTLKNIGLNLKQKYDGSKSIKRNDIYWLLDKPEFVNHIKELGYHSVKFPESKSLETTHKLPPSNTYMVFDPSKLSIANNLGKSKTLEKAIAPKDFSKIKASHSKGVTTAIDFKNQIKNHPAYEGYLNNVVNNPEIVKNRLDRSGGIATKTIHDVVPGQASHQLSFDDKDAPKTEPATYMTKPYFAHAESSTKSYSKHPIKGWATLTTKDLLHAADMGHMAEDVQAHVHNGVPVTVHKFSEEHEPIVGGSAKIHPLDAQKIAVMDFLTGNNDRHSGNIMVSKQPYEDEDRGELYHSPLLIDHERNFQYNRTLNNKFGKYEPSSRETPANFLHNNYTMKQITSAFGYPEEHGDDLHSWWTEAAPKVKEAFNKNIEHIKDPTLRSHIENNFNQRMDHLQEHLIDGNYYDMFRVQPNKYHKYHGQVPVIEGVRPIRMKRNRVQSA